MPLLVRCPACGRAGRVPDGCEGRTARCGACGGTFRVPAGAGPAPPAADVPRTPKDLAAFVAGRGHPEFVCLSPRYSPSSRVPCVDFSRWLCDRIEAEESEAVADFVWRVVEGNPGIGLGADGFREHWRRSARRLLHCPLDTYLRGGTKRAYVELRAALVLLLLHDSFGGFIMATDAPRYLATVMVPHRFEPIGADLLAKRANAFIWTMRKDTPFWEHFPLFRTDVPSPWQSPPDPAADGFCVALRALPLGSRSHFFDVIAPLRSVKGSTPQRLDRASSYMTRKRGLDEAESAACLLRSGLLVGVQDQRAALRGMSAGQLMELLSTQGVAYRKSWKKEKLVSAILDECPAAAQAAAQGMGLADIAPQHVQAAAWAQAHIDRVTPFFQLWLGFGVEGDR